VNVTIVDYGVGNLRSLRRGLERAGADVTISDDPAVVANADALVLPGVGAFEECVRNLAPFRDAVVRAAREGTPILGVCVGLQLLYEESEEGALDGETIEGLGLLPGRVVRLPDGAVKIPHIGWNELRIERDHPLVDGVADGDYAYFVHSYCRVAGGDGERSTTVASCEHGRRFAAVAASDEGRVMGTQFHPEKSGETGLRILENFVTYAASLSTSPSGSATGAGRPPASN
jgi:glutamine amidotransferase